MNNLTSYLSFLYGVEKSPALLDRLQRLIDDYRSRIPARNGNLTEKDSLLITYGDQLTSPDEKPLQTLGEFSREYLTGVITGIHILPFYPWTSDDGFSVMDYREVNTSYGNWNDVKKIGEHFRLMFDAVINHVSVNSLWFQSMLRGDDLYQNYFVIP